MRLICLSRSLHPSGALQGEVEVHDLGSAPRYQAISYAWGDATPVGKLYTNQGYINLTRNLTDALNTFRSISGSLLFWIDAICINQADNTEKAHQVQRMRDVFRSAVKVLAYLGPFDADEAKSVAGLAKSTRVLPEQYDAYNPAKAVIGRAQCLPPLDQTHKGWPAYRKILDLPFFYRIWILQEVAVAKEVACFLGGEPLDISELADLQWAANSYRMDLGKQGLFPPETNSAQTSSIGVMMSTRRDVLSSFVNPLDRLTMIQLLIRGVHLESTLMRDKIFALRGLAFDGDAPGLRPDYEAPLHVVVRRFAKHLIQNAGPSALESACHWSTDDEIPTWSPPLQRQARLYRGIRGPGPWKAGGSGSFERSWSSDDKFFVPKGSIIDTIDQVMSHLRSPTADLSAMEYLLEVTYAAASAQNPYPTNEDWETIIPTTALANRCRSSPDANVEQILPQYSILMKPFVELLEKNPKASWTFEPAAHLPPSTHSRHHLAAEAEVFSRTYRPCLTTKKYLGIVPKWSKSDDCIAVLKGAGPLYVLRKTAGYERYRIVGECYIHGIMNGEALSWPQYQESDLFIW